MRLALDGRGSKESQLVRAVIATIERGELARGARLPSTRAVVAALGIARTAVIAAYDELVARGIAVARRGAGTFVA